MIVVNGLRDDSLQKLVVYSRVVMIIIVFNKLDYVVGYNLFVIWRLKKKKKKVYKYELNRVKVYVYSFFIGIYIWDYYIELILFLFINILRSLKVVKYIIKKMGRCKINVWLFCNIVLQYFNDYICYSYN